MTNEELISLIDYSSPFCVSIIVPTHRVSPERQQDHLVVKKAVDASKTLLKMKSGRREKNATLLCDKLDAAFQQVDFVHVNKGLGIFVGEEITKVVHFPFEVHQKIAVNSHFSSLELYCYLHSVRSYKLLLIQQQAIHLYNGNETSLNEIMNVDFPSIYEEEFEYSPSSKITSHGSTVMKQYEKDTQELHEIRQKAFYRRTDNLLSKYFQPEDEVILSAGVNEISNFFKVSKNKNLFDGQLSGGFAFKDTISLGIKAWEKLKEIEHLKMEKILTLLKEDFGRNLAVYGLQQVINAAEDGKGRNLLLDKDFNYLGHVTANGLTYHSGTRSKDKEHFVVNEVYERVIKIVSAAGGKILFVNKGMLDDYEGIAMQLRYP
jgi:hypothetical protein